MGRTKSKKWQTTFLSLMLVLVMLLPTFSFGSANASTVQVLRVYNCEDYLDEGFILGDNGDDGDFASWFENTYGGKVKVEYLTFGTNEIMYNNLKINNSTYDLICPSDYMIEKMAREGMLEKMDYTKLPTYLKNVTPYITDTVLKNASWTVDGVTSSLYDYAVCYMWGTMGLIYAEDAVTDESMHTWETLWNDYSKQSTIKDSIRDSYFLGLVYVYREELTELANEYATNQITFESYQAELKTIVNRTDLETLEKVEYALKELKSNIYGFEVDSGKGDVASGKININFAWSGDAVYAMDEADAVNKTLKYYVPHEGSNVWFDGWVMPKGANKDLAYAFLEYLSRPSIAVRNMENIGYTSPIIGDETFSITYEEDGAEPETVEYTGVKDWIMQYFDVSDVQSTEYPYENDLTYFIGQKLYGAEQFRQFETQFPSQSVVTRCSVMQYFDEATNTAVTEMWERVKGSTLPTWLLILIVVLIVLATIAVTVWKFWEQITRTYRKWFKKKGKADEKVKTVKPKPKCKKGLKVVSVEEIE